MHKHVNSMIILQTRCVVAMSGRKRQDISDSVCWYCSRCKATKSIRESSFFSKSRLPDCKDEAEVDKKTAIDVYQWLQEVCTTHLIQDLPIVLGGPGKVVQIDESLFRHKPKVPFSTGILKVMLPYLFVYNIIVVELQEVKYWSSEWLTLHMSLH